jgi:hypothetical protein
VTRLLNKIAQIPEKHARLPREDLERPGERRTYHLGGYLVVDGDALGWWFVSLNLNVPQ